MFTQWVIGIVAFIGEETKLSLHGGAAAAASAATAKREEEERLKAVQEAQRISRLPQPVPAERLESDTGLKWEEVFTDVPDDGNCMVHAFWLGLRTLLERHPELEDPEALVLPASAAECRAQAMQALFEDEVYVQNVRNQFVFWITELDLSILLGHIEDFFVMPPDFQALITNYNQSWRTGKQDVDYDGIIAAYSKAMRETTNVNGRDTYVPLGEHELAGFCRAYRCRINVIKSESLDPAVFPSPVDPCVIPPDLVHDINRSSPRVVRLLNVNTNHYQLHLPK